MCIVNVICISYYDVLLGQKVDFKSTKQKKMYQFSEFKLETRKKNIIKKINSIQRENKIFFSESKT